MRPMMDQPLPLPLRTHYLSAAAMNVFFLLCWAGVVPLWRLLPPRAQAAVLPLMRELYQPAMVYAGAIVLVALLRFAGMHGWLDRLARLVLQICGIGFAFLLLRAIVALPPGGLDLGADWTAVLEVSRLGASFVLMFLPLVAAIVVIVGALDLAFRAWRYA
jgi:hypothetical protein